MNPKPRKAGHITILPFNMVEIVIALAIIMVALIGIMGLIPPSIKAGQDAVNRSNAADAADQFLRYMASRLAQNWNEEVAFPSEKPTGNDQEMVFSSESLIADAKMRIYFETPNELASWNPEVNNNGVFKIVQMTGENNTDFKGVLRAWKELTEYGEGENRPKSLTLYTEVSWPATKPYEKRDTAKYQLEMFKPGEFIVAATPPPPAEGDGFSVVDGSVVLNEAQATTITSLGCGMSYGLGNQLNVTVSFSIDDVTYEPFGPSSNPVDGNVNDGGQHVYDAGILEAGSEIGVTGRSWRLERDWYDDSVASNWNPWMSQSSSPPNQNVLVLVDGDPVPDIDPFGDQADIADFVEDYIDPETGTVTLAPNQAILLFELYTENLSDSTADFQDLVLLINFTNPPE